MMTLLDLIPTNQPAVLNKRQVSGIRQSTYSASTYSIDYLLVAYMVLPLSSLSNS